jgi:GGDEF domain-containing protein
MDRDFQDFSVTCSIGIAMYPADGINVASLVEKADKAAYAVKRKGKNGFAFYSDLL